MAELINLNRARKTKAKDAAKAKAAENRAAFGLTKAQRAAPAAAAKKESRELDGKKRD
jgi:hypothetical protein